MGRRRKAPEKPHRRNVAGAEGVADQQEKDQIEEKGIVEAAVCMIRHFIGAFSPSVL
jgi:hypothetical protein